jgi:hypothetical protein
VPDRVFSREVPDEDERSERIRGYRDELLGSLQRAYEGRRLAPDHSLQLLRQTAEGLCYCTLLAKNRLGLDQHRELSELIRLSVPFLKEDERALQALREWGNRTSHAQGRPDKATIEEATAMFLMTANPMRWLYREILHEPVPSDLEERYSAITQATRVGPPLHRPPSELAAARPAAPLGRRGARVASWFDASAGAPGGGAKALTVAIVGGVLGLLTLATIVVYVFALKGGASPGAAERVVPKNAATDAGRVLLANDGTDGDHPILPDADVGFVDARRGWGWGDKCWRNIKAKKWGWARAECDEGLRMDPASPQPRASLLYNEGLIAKERGQLEEARADFTESLSLRENAEVRAALGSVTAP